MRTSRPDVYSSAFACSLLPPSQTMRLMSSNAKRIRARITHRRLAAVACLALFAFAAAARGAPSDADFVAARSAFERGDRGTLAALAAPFANHLLEPYVAYWQVKLALDAATRDDVRGYWER